MTRTKKQLLERIQYLEGEVQGLEEVLVMERARLEKNFQDRNELKDNVLKELLSTFPDLFQSVINQRHPGNDTDAKIAKIREYHALFGWGLYFSKVFVETGKIPE